MGDVTSIQTNKGDVVQLNEKFCAENGDLCELAQKADKSAIVDFNAHVETFDNKSWLVPNEGIGDGTATQDEMLAYIRHLEQLRIINLGETIDPKHPKECTVDHHAEAKKLEGTIARYEKALENFITLMEKK